MNLFIKTVDKFSGNILNALKRFPIATLLAFIVTTILISVMELKYLGLPTDSEDILIAKKVALVASIGVFLFPALRMLFSNRVITFSGFAILIWTILSYL